MPEEQISALRSSKGNTGTSLDVFLKMHETVLLEQRLENYSQTIWRRIIKIANLFDFFMEMKQLYYSLVVGEVWIRSLRPSLNVIEYKHFRRVLCLLAQLYRKEPLPLNVNGTIQTFSKIKKIASL